MLLLSALAFGQSWSGILAPARATTWEGNAGAIIPSGGWDTCVTSQCNTVAGGNVTPATVNAALLSAPGSSVVTIPAGNFTISSSIFNNRGNVALRGAGPNQTTINLTNGANILFTVTGSGGQGGFPGNLGSTNFTGGLTKGSTALTLASTAGIVGGQRIVLDQHNAPYVFVDGIENGVGGHCFPGNSCGRNDSPLKWDGNDTRAQQEMVEVLQVNDATHLTIKAPGIGHDYTAGLAPQAFFWNNGGNISFAGVENMKVNANSINFAISMPWCDNCWVKNVWVTNIARTAVFFEWGMHDEVRDSYFSSNNAVGGPTQYGIELLETTFAKVENNIFFGITSPILFEGSYGLVQSYNYARNTATGAQFASWDNHLAHSWETLMEGNATENNPSFDNSWGSASHNTVFRNWALGHSPNKNNYRYPMKVTAHSWYQNIVGNVFGDIAYHTRYVCNQANPSPTDNFIYNLGFWGDCINGIDGSNPYDTSTESTLMRWDNWDAATYNANGGTNGIRKCTGAGLGNPACTVSETASTDPSFPGLVNPLPNLPASFYTGSLLPHPSCGTGLPFWKNPADGSCPPYPPIGPDVACTTSCNANTANHAAMIPAQVCYVNGPKDGNGFLTSFDAASCYAVDPILQMQSQFSGTLTGTIQ